MQGTLIFMLKNVLANCKIYDSQTKWLITYNMSKLNLYHKFKPL